MSHGHTLSRRLSTGETDVADAFEEATVMFVYLDGYKELILQHPPEAVVAWLNRGVLDHLCTPGPPSSSNQSPVPATGGRRIPFRLNTQPLPTPLPQP